MQIRIASMTSPLEGGRSRPNPDSARSRSFAAIDREFPEPRPFRGHAWEVARHLIHVGGDLTLARDLALPEAAVEKGVKALKMGAPIHADTRMVRAGIADRRVKALGGTIECLRTQPGVTSAAIRAGIPRSRAAMFLAEPKYMGAIVVLGGAPASLLTLMEMMDDMFSLTSRPTLIIGMPAGFADAAEAKALLEASPWTMLTVRGSKGGPALAAAAANALMEIALREREREGSL